MDVEQPIRWNIVKRGMSALFCLSLMAGTLLFTPLHAFGGEEIGTIITTNGPVGLYTPGGNSLSEVKMGDTIGNSVFIVTGAKGGVQLTLSYKISLSVGSDSIVSIYRKSKKKSKKENYLIALFRGTARATGFKRLFPSDSGSRKDKVKIQSPFGTVAYHGADVVMRMEETSGGGVSKGGKPYTVPCPSNATAAHLKGLAQLLSKGELDQGVTFEIVPCPSGAKGARVLDSDFKFAALKKRTEKSATGEVALRVWTFSGEADYFRPGKRRASITLKRGEKALLDEKGLAIVR